jgi:hypothetical protein
MTLRQRVDRLSGGRQKEPWQDEWIHILAAETDEEKDAVVERLRSRFPEWVENWFEWRARGGSPAALREESRREREIRDSLGGDTRPPR